MKLLHWFLSWCFRMKEMCLRGEGLCQFLHVFLSTKSLPVYFNVSVNWIQNHICTRKSNNNPHKKWNRTNLRVYSTTNKVIDIWNNISCVKWYMKCFKYWTADLKSSKLWTSQLWTQFKQLRIEAWKSQGFNGVWNRDLAIPVRRSNQLSYEPTDVGSWSCVSSGAYTDRLLVSSNEPVKNGCEVIYEMFHMLNCGFEIK